MTNSISIRAVLFAFALSLQSASAANLTDIISISAGQGQSMALKTDGTVWVWGVVYDQIVEDGAFETVIPLQVLVDHKKRVPLRGVIYIGHGTRFEIMSKKDGPVLVSTRELGYHERAALPLVLETAEGVALENIVKVAAGSGHDLFLRNDGTVWAWGSNYAGQLGDGTEIDRASPSQVVTNSNTNLPLAGIVDIAAGNGYSLALKRDGTVWIWGGITSQLDGFYMNSTTAVQALNDSNSAGPITDVVDIADGPSDGIGFLGLKNNGTVWHYPFLAINDEIPYWVSDCPNTSGEPRQRDTMVPTQVMVDSESKMPLENVISIDGNWIKAVALKNDGTVWQWGRSEGILSHEELYPVQVLMDENRSVPFTGATFVSAGDNHTLALKSDGSVWAWGLNENGQLGTNNDYPSRVPVQVLRP